MSFAKMLKEKKFERCIPCKETDACGRDFPCNTAIQLNDQAEWEWENGGKRFVETYIERFKLSRRKDVINYFFNQADWVVGHHNYNAKEGVQAFCFLRTYDYAIEIWGKKKGEAWIETKIKEMEK